MIYLDSSVVLARLLAEDRQPGDDLWNEYLTSSRLLQYEVWSRVHMRGLDGEDHERVRDLLQGIDFVEMSALALARALEPFPLPIRTLDALHLATMDFLRGQGQRIELATYDARLADAARAIQIPLR